MKAALFVSPNVIEVKHDLPEPEFKEGILVKVKTTGFCATDVKTIKGLKKSNRPLPAAFGHEFSGVVVKTTINKYKEGDRVSVSPFCGCGHCVFCLGGEEQLCKSKTFFSGGSTSDYVAVNPMLANKAGFVMPADVTWEEGAMTEPLACVLLSLRSTGFKPGESVLVLGAGFMGMLHVLLAKSWGASRVMVSEPSKFRRETAVKFGADVLDPTTGVDVGEWARSLCGEGPNIIIAAAGTKPVADSAFKAAGLGTRIHLFGGMPTGTMIDVSADDIHYKRITLLGTSGFRSVDVQTAADMIKGHSIDLKPLVTHRFSVEEAQAAFEMAQQENALKVMMENADF
ncbi:MAG: alcohol dehydrogenase catalytic domain-containing protein [Pelolinea sp.]|nr:alcohol dehydrogenase catalytic domain-containing protein [Pelolinea sp.]